MCLTRLYGRINLVGNFKIKSPNNEEYYGESQKGIRTVDPPSQARLFFTLISKRVRLEEIIATEKSSHVYTDTTKQIIHSYGHTQFQMLSLANSQALLDSNIISPTLALTHTH